MKTIKAIVRTIAILCIAFVMGCDQGPISEPTQCVAPFANASITYGFCETGATKGKAVCEWMGANPPYPLQLAGECQATADIECVEECPSTPPTKCSDLGTNLTVTSCPGHPDTAICQVEDEGPHQVVGCDSGSGLQCVNSCKA